MLWRELRKLETTGTHFRRQVPFRAYILDFVEHSAKLVIELDGGQHGEDAHRSRDEIRDSTLRSEGYRVMRFWNADVLTDVDLIAESILAELKGRERPPTRAAWPPDLPTARLARGCVGMGLVGDLSGAAAAYAADRNAIVRAAATKGEG